MYGFINKYKIVIGVVVVLIITVLVLIIIYQRKPTSLTQSVDNQTGNYQFLSPDSGLSDEDQYLMLLAKINAEGFWTYSNQDLSGLQNVQNQSTSQFAVLVMKKIMNISDLGQVSISLSVDPDSIKLSRRNNSAQVQMKGQYKENDLPSEQVITSVSLFKQGEFWLVDNIVIE